MVLKDMMVAMKKLLLLLASQKGYTALDYLCKKYRKYIGVVISFDEVGVLKNLCEDIQILCYNINIPFFKWNGVKDSLAELIRENGITGMICISWKYLIPISLNELLQDDIIVFHDSILPKYRRFAPIVTAMICGDTEVGATALYAADRVDAGDIVLQKSFPITTDDDISNVIERMSDLHSQMAEEVLHGITEETLPRIQQDESKATYSIWRDEDDYWIDWGKSADEMSWMIRAVGYPYKGALTSDGIDKFRIIKCSVMDKDINFAIRTPGKLWNISENIAIVVCGIGMLRIEEAYNENGSVHVFSKLCVKLGGRVSLSDSGNVISLKHCA